MQVTATDLSGTTNLLSRLRIASQNNPRLTLAQKYVNLAQFMNGLIAIIEAGLCHGDIKPQNWLLIKPTDKKKAQSDITDFGGSKIIYPKTEHMKTDFRFESEADKVAMKNLVVALLAKKPNPKQLEAACKVQAKVNQLLELNILQKREDNTLVVVNKPRLEELREYLNTEFLPAHTDAYRSQKYIQAMCDFFWRCDPENYRKACNAFDMRAAGITMYQYLAGTNLTPKDENDEEYYASMPQNLAQKVSAVAINILCRMAKPLDPKPGHPNAPFDTPVSIDELKTLKAIFSQPPQ
ncbi:MAG: serine/threonine-protein kinase [Chlamydiales bacterium]|nr:serine/threonine-protein kinase [Chlamydiales bacterium]